MGFVIMAIVTTIVFFILKIFLPTLWALLFALLFYEAWYRFNYYSGTTGLVKANMFAYFTARRKGLSHEEALEWVIYTRFPGSVKEQELIKQLFWKLSDTETEEDDLKLLVYIIFSYENGVPPTTEWKIRIMNIIDTVYDKMTSRFGIE